MIVMVKSESVTEGRIPTTYEECNFTLYGDGEYIKQNLPWCRELTSRRLVKLDCLQAGDIVDLHGVRRQAGASYQRRAGKVRPRNSSLEFAMNQLLQTFDILVTQIRSGKPMSHHRRNTLAYRWTAKTPLAGPHGLRMYLNNEKTPCDVPNSRLVYGTVENIPAGWMYLPQVTGFLMLLPRIWALTQQNIRFWGAFGDTGGIRSFRESNMLWKQMARSVMIPLWIHQYARHLFWGFLHLLTSEVLVKSKLLDAEPRIHWVCGPESWMRSNCVAGAHHLDETNRVISCLQKYGPTFAIDIPLL